MKHIGWCLDNIQMEMVHIPRALNSEDDKQKASSILDQIQKYANTLAEIITNSEFRKYLNQLENAPIEGVKLQAHEIEELFKDLMHMLQVLDLYLKNLREIITSKPEEWSGKADQLVLMIDQKFGGERGDLRKEFEAVIHTEEQLKQLVSSEEHLAEFLK